MVVGLKSRDLVIGELGSVEMVRNVGIGSERRREDERESRNDGELVDNLASLISDLLLGLVDVLLVSVLVEGDLIVPCQRSTPFTW